MDNLLYFVENFFAAFLLTFSHFYVDNLRKIICNLSTVNFLDIKGILSVFNILTATTTITTIFYISFKTVIERKERKILNEINLYKK